MTRSRLPRCPVEEATLLIDIVPAPEHRPADDANVYAGYRALRAVDDAGGARGELVWRLGTGDGVEITEFASTPLTAAGGVAGRAPQPPARARVAATVAKLGSFCTFDVGDSTGHRAGGSRPKLGSFCAFDVSNCVQVCPASGGGKFGFVLRIRGSWSCWRLAGAEIGFVLALCVLQRPTHPPKQARGDAGAARVAWSILPGSPHAAGQLRSAGVRRRVSA